MTGVVKLLPVDKGLPPVKTAYHLIVVPAEPVAANPCVPLPHRVLPALDTTDGLFTVTRITFEELEPPKEQTAFNL